jgi:hypothetical protein
MNLSGIELATILPAAQCVNKQRHRVPLTKIYEIKFAGSGSQHNVA